MVCVWPPQTSMNLNLSPRARSVMDFTSARAAAGSRNSSTNFILRALSGDFGFVEGVDLLLIVLAHLLHLIQSDRRFAFVDLGHRETDVHEHPVTHLQVVVGEQPHADVSANTIDVDFGQMLFGID